MDQVLIRIIYDNRKENPAMQEGWGFSCMIEVGKRKILFDTGANTEAFFRNLQEMRLDLSEVTDLFCSHKHADHTTGLREIVSNMKEGVRVFLPKGFSFSSSSCQVTPICDFLAIDDNIYSFVLKGGFWLYEQALVVRSNKGLIVITGCAHPGIVHLVETVKERLHEQIHLVLGGFHLFRKNRTTITQIVEKFKCLQVEKAAPCHCSGDPAIAAFQHSYLHGFYKIGTGSVIRIE